MASANNLATSTPPRGPISPSTTLVYPVTPSRLSVPAHPAGPRSANRPPSISELATLAKEGLLNGPKDLKHYLRTAQRSRDLGKEYVKAGDLEAAFVEFARAASIVLDILPAHQDYLSLLNESQRHNLGLNGQDILANLSKIKPTLVERYERWHGSQEHSDSSSPGPLTPQTYQEDPPIARRSRVEPFPIQEEDQYASVREKARERRIYDDTRGSSSDEEAKRRDTVEVARRRQADEYARRQQDDPRRREDEQRTREAAALAYRAREERGPVYGPRPMDGDAIVARMDEMRISNLRQQPSPNEDARRRDEETTRRREEEATRRRLDDRRREEAEGIMKRQQEAEAAARATRTQLNSAYVPPVLTSSLQSAYSQGQEGIAHRQREAEEAARVARQEFNASGLPVSAPPNMISSAQQAAAMREREESVRRQHEAEAIARAARPPATPTSSSALAAPTAVSTSQYQFLESHHRQGVPIMPLESPSKYEDDSSTDVSVTDGPSMPRQTMRRDKEPEQTPSKPPRRSPSYPTPVTTTSPPPPDLGAIRYPSLMTKHQMTQGYTPSLESMFMKHAPMPSASNLLFDTQGSDLFSSMPRIISPSYGPHGVSYPPIPQLHQHHHHHRSYPSNGPPSSYPTQPSPIGSTGSGSDRITRADSKSDGPVPDLKTVNLPRDCLPRFLSIAAVNTARNRETCGLLLGRDKGHKYVVSTLLIPKQHATSDTCTMDEEELVLEFMEERNLITLGWIHTHPTQSCFMSSVDLHTHCGFQRMLPESFAVVCAPSSTPNFGIFRLTDPPGLQTILDCKAKEAFHPHPDVPIYTDADKGHVQMKDTNLEIVDLR